MNMYQGLCCAQLSVSPLAKQENTSARWFKYLQWIGWASDSTQTWQTWKAMTFFTLPCSAQNSAWYIRESSLNEWMNVDQAWFYFFAISILMPSFPSYSRTAGHLAPLPNFGAPCGSASLLTRCSILYLANWALHPSRPSSLAPAVFRTFARSLVKLHVPQCLWCSLCPFQAPSWRLTLVQDRSLIAAVLGTVAGR